MHQKPRVQFAATNPIHKVLAGRHRAAHDCEEAHGCGSRYADGTLRQKNRCGVLNAKLVGMFACIEYLQAVECPDIRQLKPGYFTFPVFRMIAARSVPGGKLCEVPQAIPAPTRLS